MAKKKKSSKTNIWGDLKDSLKGFDKMFQKHKGKKGGLDAS